MLHIFDVRPSFYLLAFLTGLHGFALAVLLSLARNHTVLYVLLPFVCCSGVYYYQKNRGGGLQLWLCHRQWFMVTPERGWVMVQVEPTSIVTRYVMIIIFSSVIRARAPRFCLVLCGDSLPVSEMRRLRLLLRSGWRASRY